MIYCAGRMRYESPLEQRGGCFDRQMKSTRLAHGTWARSLSPSVIGRSLSRRLFGTAKVSATGSVSPRRTVAARAGHRSMGEERLEPRVSYVSGRAR